MLKVLSPVMDLCRQHGRGELGRLPLEVAEGLADGGLLNLLGDLDEA